jgi:negative regulator of sigma E activity
LVVIVLYLEQVSPRLLQLVAVQAVMELLALRHMWVAQAVRVAVAVQVTVAVLLLVQEQPIKVLQVQQEHNLGVLVLVVAVAVQAKLVQLTAQLKAVTALRFQLVVLQ